MKSIFFDFVVKKLELVAGTVKMRSVNFGILGGVGGILYTEKRKNIYTFRYPVVQIGNFIQDCNVFPL